MEERVFEGQRARWESEYSSKGVIWRGPQSLRLDLQPGSRVLELGCGNGKTLSALMGMRAWVCGLDFSRAAIKSCMRSVGGASLVLADAIDLPFADGSFHAVLAFHLLEHLSRSGRERCSREITRVLTPGGRVLARVLCTADMRWGNGEEVEPNTFLGGSGLVTHFFEEEELRLLFGSMKVIRLERMETRRLYSGTPVRRAVIAGEFLLVD